MGATLECNKAMTWREAMTSKRNLVGWRPQWPSTTSSCAKPWNSSMSSGPPIAAFSVPGGKLFGASSSWFSGARGSPGWQLPVVGSQGWEAAASAVVAATELDWAAAGLVRSMQVRAARMIHARREAMVKTKTRGKCRARWEGGREGV